MTRWLKKRWWILIIALLVVLILGFTAWGLIIPNPMPEALSAMQSDASVTVTVEHWISFTPVAQLPDTGFIIYPGGRVNPQAYAPAAHRIAAKGYLVVIVPMPLNLAVFGSERASEVIQSHPEIQHWAIGGHSLGGSMAALYADKHREQISGLVLWASYPASSNSLADSKIKVVSIFASLDGLATREKIDASRTLLPADTTWVQIEGGNHAQFGWYGDQPGDHPATISRKEQQAQIITATLSLLSSISY